MYKLSAFTCSCYVLLSWLQCMLITVLDTINALDDDDILIARKKSASCRAEINV